MMSNDSITIGDKTYERHPYSAVFPLMAAEDYALLLSSMRQSGQHVSVKLIGERLVFDGWNRLRACAELNIEPVFESVAEDQDLQALTIALNLAHRHLTAGQKGLIAGQLATMTHGGQRPGTGAWQNRSNGSQTLRAGNSTADSTEHQDLKLDLDGHIDDMGNAAETAQNADGSKSGAAPSDAYNSPQSPAPNTLQASAEQLGISRATAAMGKRVSEHGDESLLNAVKAGDISLAEGYEIAKSPREEQRDRVKHALANGKEWLKKNKKNCDLSEKIAKAVLKGEALPDGLTDRQIADVFHRVADSIVVSAMSAANCINAHREHFTDSHMTQIIAAERRLSESIARRSPGYRDDE